MSDQSPPAGPPSSSDGPDPVFGSSGPQPADPTPPGAQPPIPAAPVPYPYPNSYPYPGAPGGYPGYPPYGWYPPPGYGLDPADPLVTPPGVGVGGWVTRCVDAFRRGWRLLLPILLLTQVLPAVVLSVLGLAVDPSARWEAQLAADADALPPGFLVDLAGFLGLLLGGSLLLGLVQCLGWAAGTWVIARQAAGAPADLGAALRYGLRRAVGLWGWTLLFTLIITVGFCFCLLPGIYAASALAMAGPVYLFERRDPIGRSHRMLRDRLGLLLGRVALVLAAVVVVSVIGTMVESLGIAPFGTTPLDSPGSTVGVLLVIGLAALLALPAHAAQLVGLVVTYAEQRAHEGPVNSAQLAAELD